VWLLVCDQKRKLVADQMKHASDVTEAETKLIGTCAEIILTIEMIVVSDLEFVGLKRHPAYEHRRATREVEQVPPELSGTLERKDQNIIVLSESKAAANAQRQARIRAKTKKLLQAANVGNGQMATEQPPLEEPPNATQESPTPVVPELTPRQPAAWWARFVFSGVPIPQADAIMALRSILSELRIAVDGQALSFQNDFVSQGAFVSTLERLTRSDLGWRTLVQIYEREKQRADH
jgi:hypothetical protein